MYRKRAFILFSAVCLAMGNAVAQDLKDSVNVHFPLGVSSYSSAYRDNGHVLDSLLSLVRQRLSENKYRLNKVQIVGCVSPEGNYNFNKKLSEKRAVVLYDTLSSKIDFSHVPFTHTYVMQDWPLLLRLVQSDAKVPCRNEVIALLQEIISLDASQGQDQLQPQYKRLYARLRNIGKGSAYQYLSRNLFPELRTASLTLAYDRLPQPEKPVVQEEKKPEPPVVQPEPQKPVEQPVVVEPQPQLREPMLAVKTNLLYDLATALNIGVEFYPHNSRWSIHADYTCPWWSNRKNHLFFQAINGSLEGRRYFKKEGHVGHYLSVYGHANLYDIGFNEELGWQGEGWGGGLGYGHVWQPWKNRRWKLEAFIRVGYFHSIYDPYHAGETRNDKYYYDWEGPIENFIRRNHRLRWFGPTGLGITLSYDLLNRKVKK